MPILCVKQTYNTMDSNAKCLKHMHMLTFFFFCRGAYLKSSQENKAVLDDQDRNKLLLKHSGKGITDFV